MRFSKLLTAVATAAVVAMLFCASAFADVTSQKGNLTIQSTEAGKSYDVYRVLDLTNDGNGHYAYTINADFAGYFTAHSLKVSDISAMTSDSTTLSNLAKDLLDYAITQNITPAASVTASGSSATINNLPYGYYLLNPLGGLGSKNVAQYATMFALGTLSGETADTTIDVKASYPTVLKKFVDGGEARYKSATIGDTIGFIVEGTVPDMTGYTTYWYNLDDKLDAGFSLDLDSFVVKIDGTVIDKSQYSVYTKNVIASPAYTRIFIVFKNFIQYKDQVGDTIELTYNAVLNDSAVLYDSLKTSEQNANNNVVYALYSNDPKASYAGNTPADVTDPANPVLPTWHTASLTTAAQPFGVTPESKVSVYTLKLNIFKYNGTAGETASALDGAKFAISGTTTGATLVNGYMYVEDAAGSYYMLKSGLFSTTAPTADTAYLYDAAGKTYKKQAFIDEDTVITNIIKEGYVLSNGYISFAGLSEGTYTITELVAPQGFNALTDPISVVVTFDANTQTFSVTADGQPASVEDASSVLKDGSFTAKVANYAGKLMPSTGGEGTTVLYIVGAALLIIATAALIVRKRMQQQ